MTGNEYIKVPSVARSGVKIPVGVTVPGLKEGEKCPVVIMTHGYLGNRDEWGLYYGAQEAEYGFTSLAERLLEFGIGSIRMDFSGTGESEESFEAYTPDNCVADVRDAVDYCLANYPFDQTKVGLVGLSMGAKIGFRFIRDREDIPVTVLLNPAGGNGSTSLKGGETPALDYDNLEAVAMKEGKALDKAASELYEKEMWLSKDFFTQMDETMTADEIKAYTESGKRALMVFGGADTVINQDTYELLAKEAGVQIAMIPHMNHDVGLEEERFDYTKNAVDLIAAYLNTYLKL